MDYTWSLKELYTAFDSKEYIEDFNNMRLDIIKINDWSKDNFATTEDAAQKLETYISMQNDFSKYFKLFDFATLIYYADAKNNTALKNIEMLEDLLTETVQGDFLFEKFISNIDNLQDIISSSKSLKVHEFFIKQIKLNSKYLLSEQEEITVSKLKTTGSAAWEKQRDFLTSMLMVDININGEPKQLPFSVIRNMAYNKDSDTRKNAYEAELLSYKKIDSAISFSLNAIKGEVITIANLRGYDSPLDMTLKNARMDKETLNALLGAIKDSLPVFRKFFKKKAEMLNHKNGLPFYDIFAPIGEIDMQFTYPQAAAYIVDNFSKFSKNLGDYAQRAFDNNWIDVSPREGKSGGAFCSNLHSIGESRILTNFTGTFSDVITLAHELGHGYHGEMLMDQTFLNSDYSMPIAETASTMCETIVLKAATKTATKQEAIVILENDITGMAQVVVDIYSRFLFEDELFKRRTNGSLSVEELNDIMIHAQKEAYGDGVDQNCLHPYMWACKTHYYSAETNYYNFPYAYGLLFSKGLYALYLKQGDKFVTLYDELLKSTGKSNLRDVAKLADIETRNKSFWASSLNLIEQDIEYFLGL